MTQRYGWTWFGQGRPEFADAPRPGQRSVWDFPRPPRLESEPRRVRVALGEQVLADSGSGLRVCETASPPTVYLPPEDCNLSALQAAPGASFCEWKGRADYLATPTGDVVAWRYDRPRHPFKALAGWLSFYPGRVACWLADERVRPQPGGFYGGWVTDDLAGPFKGEPNTGHW